MTNAEWKTLHKTYSRNTNTRYSAVNKRTRQKAVCSNVYYQVEVGFGDLGDTGGLYWLAAEVLGPVGNWAFFCFFCWLPRSSCLLQYCAPDCVTGGGVSSGPGFVLVGEHTVLYTHLLTPGFFISLLLQRKTTELWPVVRLQWIWVIVYKSIYTQSTLMN